MPLRFTHVDGIILWSCRTVFTAYSFCAVGANLVFALVSSNTGANPGANLVFALVFQTIAEWANPEANTRFAPTGL